MSTANSFAAKTLSGATGHQSESLGAFGLSLTVEKEGRGGLSTSLMLIQAMIGFRYTSADSPRTVMMWGRSAGTVFRGVW
jgi:hypothetical protein